jgi:hypothetical protein
MTHSELRQKIDRQLETLLPEQLALVSAFLDILQSIANFLPFQQLKPIQRDRKSELDLESPADPKARMRATLTELKTHPKSSVPPKRSTSKLGNLRKFAGTWSGDDLKPPESIRR